MMYRVCTCHGPSVSELLSAPGSTEGLGLGLFVCLYLLILLVSGIFVGSVSFGALKAKIVFPTWIGTKAKAPEKTWIGFYSLIPQASVSKHLIKKNNFYECIIVLYVLYLFVISNYMFINFGFMWFYFCQKAHNYILIFY